MAKETKTDSTAPAKSGTPLMCGLVMPISAIDGCSAEHWAEVKSIITDAIEGLNDPPFGVKLVSEADDIGVIQKRIVQNIYSAEMVVCDVSGRNANVMFELGMRLAFDKPIVIIKDDKTDYSFDTGIIEHVTYPRDLRFTKIVEFKQALATKVANTYRASLQPDHSPFLKNFGKFQVAALSETEVSADKVILEMLDDMRREIGGLSRRIARRDHSPALPRSPEGYAKVLSFARTLIERDPSVDLHSLLGNPDFRRHAERECDAPSHFNSSEDFTDALDRALMTVARDKPRSPPI